MRLPKAWWIVFIVCALAGAMLVLYATERGVGVSPDSTAYINAARGWLIRFGIPLVPGNTSHWIPPGYSTLLAADGYLMLGADPFVVARWLDALLFALNIVCVGLILRMALPFSVWIPLLGMGLMLTSVDMLAIHTMAWSEPPFLFLSLLGLSVLVIYLERPRARWLVLASAFAAASLLMRYAGLALVATGLVAILLGKGRTGRQRIQAASVFACLALAPLAVWSLRHPLDRGLVLHLMPSEWFFTALPVVTHWFLPAEIPLPPIGIVLIAIALVCPGLFVLLAKRHKIARLTIAGELTASQGPMLARILVLYVLFYSLVILTSRLVVDAVVSPDARILAPIYPIVLIGLLYAAQRWMSSGAHIKSVKIALGGIAVLWGVLYWMAAMTWVERSHRDGQWYSSLGWQQSEIMRQVKALPRTTSIYSNGNEAITFLTSRPAARLPDKVSADTQLANPEYAADMEHIGKRLMGETVIVYLSGFEERWFLPSEPELVKRWNLVPIVRESDGTIYRRVQ